ncbi:MAG: hypothetical protein NTW86_02435 [Candidatus Sumerlaeota bacterium]|nr:hypothetical protein [Candidatus Sumerlaeota bacterium]
MTIEKAIAGCGETFQEGWRERAQRAGGDSVLATLNCSDDGNGCAIALLFGGRLRFNHTAATWHIREQDRWQLDETGAAQRIGVDAAKQRYQAAWDAPVDQEKKEVISKWALGSESQPRVAAALTAAARQVGIATTQRDWDVDHMVLGAGDCDIDLKTGNRMAPDPARLISVFSPDPYNSDATCPRWERFLEEIFNADASLQAMIWRAIGYCLTGLTVEQVFFIFFGLGKNGKTLFLRIVGLMLGGYAKTASFESFSEQKNPGGARRCAGRHSAFPEAVFHRPGESQGAQI